MVRWFGEVKSSNRQVGPLATKPQGGGGGGEDGDFEAMEFSVPLRNMKYYLNGKIWIFPKMVGFPPKSSILIGLFHYSHHPYWG